MYYSVRIVIFRSVDLYGTKLTLNLSQITRRRYFGYGAHSSRFRWLDSRFPLCSCVSTIIIIHPPDNNHEPVDGQTARLAIPHLSS